MKVEITYCGVWDYLPQASRLEDELKNNFNDVNISLHESSGGDFRVIVDEKVIWNPV